MAITRLNHAVLYVSDARASAEFYETVLGFRRLPIGPEGWTGAVFMQAPDSTNDHDLGLFSVGDQAARPDRRSVGLYHLAWEVDTLDTLEQVAERLSRARALVGASDHGTTKSLYGRDPDGIEFEIAWIVPKDLIDDAALAGRSTIGTLDLPAEQARYGRETPGGIGISQPA